MNTWNESGRTIDALQAVCHSCRSKKFDYLCEVASSIICMVLSVISKNSISSSKCLRPFGELHPFLHRFGEYHLKMQVFVTVLFLYLVNHR